MFHGVSDGKKERNVGEGCCPMEKMREIKDQPERREDEADQPGARERRKGEWVRNGGTRKRNGFPTRDPRLQPVLPCFPVVFHQISYKLDQTITPNHHLTLYSSTINPIWKKFEGILRVFSRVCAEGVWRRSTIPEVNSFNYHYQNTPLEPSNKAQALVGASE